MSEHQIIDLLKRKDEKAFAEVFRQYSGMVFSTALGLVQNHEEAEDLVQDTFVEVLRSIKGFEGKSSLKTWLYRLTITKCLDHLRAQKRHKRGGLFSFLSFRNDQSWMHRPDFNHPGVLLENKERAAILFKAISRLPENQKVAFTLSKIDDKSYQEIAEIMQCSAGAVESLLHRAK
ncbi:MAG: RNA polymerase sigma factor, partial [Owenweeksia sp.]